MIGRCLGSNANQTEETSSRGTAWATETLVHTPIAIIIESVGHRTLGERSRTKILAVFGKLTRCRVAHQYTEVALTYPRQLLIRLVGTGHALSTVTALIRR